MMRGAILMTKLPARDPHEPHRASTQLELFFDLITVVAVASVTAALHHAISDGHGLEKLPNFMFLFFTIWWAWMNFTWFASAFDNDGPVYRLLVMTLMTGQAIFAGGAGHILETLDFGWGVVGWTIMRLAMTALWLRASVNNDYRATALRYAAGIIFAQIYWTGFYFLAPPGPQYFFGFGIIGLLIELAVPVFAELARTTPFHRHHIIERYGLLLIIMLGEIVLAISLGFGSLYGEGANREALPVMISGMVIAFSLFWIYFCEAEHLPAPKFMTAFIWGYSHVFAFAAVAMIGAGLAAHIDFANGQSKSAPLALAWWLGAPLAAFLATLWIARDRHFILGARGMALPAAAAASIAAAYAGSGAPVFAAIMVVATLWRVPMREPAAS
jgi:low temperature requirement protein LtrA